MTKASPLRIAFIGAGRRSAYLYGQLIGGLPGVELVGVWGRSDESARRVADRFRVPAYTDLDRLIRHQAPQIGIVCVSYSANGEVGLMAVEQGLNVLVETPIAHKLAEADAIIAAARRKGVKVEVAEQFHRRPIEQIKLRLIESGLFGKVHSSFSDFAGHGYHGVSVMRSYLGFDARPVQVVGAVRKYPLEAHFARGSGDRGPREETQEHGIVEFDDGRLGIFHWTSVGYDSPLRWWRSSRFLAEKGMGITTGVYPDLHEELTLLAPGGEGVRPIHIDRRYERVDGGALVQVAANTGDPDIPIVTWDNPFRADPRGAGPQWHDDEIGVAGCLKSLMDAVSNGTEPTYGAVQGRLDQEIITAIKMSSMDGGRPVSLPIDPDAQTA